MPWRGGNRACPCGSWCSVARCLVARCLAARLLRGGSRACPCGSGCLVARCLVAQRLGAAFRFAPRHVLSRQFPFVRGLPCSRSPFFINNPPLGTPPRACDRAATNNQGLDDWLLDWLAGRSAVFRARLPLGERNTNSPPVRRTNTTPFRCSCRGPHCPRPPPCSNGL